MLTQNNSTQALIKKLIMSCVFSAVSLTSTGAWSDAERVETELGDVKLRLTGRFMYDTLIHSSVDSRSQDSSDWRRARLGVRARFAEDWRFRISADFPDGDANLRDLRVDYRGWPVHLAVGRMQESFGLSESSSSNHLVMMERPLATVLGPDYSTGVRANMRGKNWGLSAGLFGPDLAGLELSDSDRNNDDAINVRGTWRALRTEDLLMHVGGSISRRDPTTDRGVRFNAQPETTLVSNMNISHPRIMDAKHYSLGGLELGLRRGPGLLQAEYLRASVARSTAESASFSGYYLQASWTLSGEKRRYSTRNGVFAGIDPKQPLASMNPRFWEYGAWEVAVSYSALDLRDADVDLDGDVDGERGDVFAVGVNWYPMANTRFMLNVLRFTEETGTSSNSDAAIQMRAQLYF